MREIKLYVDDVLRHKFKDDVCLFTQFGWPCRYGIKVYFFVCGIIVLRVSRLSGASE